MNPLISSLLATLPREPPPRLIETHISWVILAGGFAYKLKKPLDLGFLDFSTLDKRQACCREELRLNQRLAPHIYLDVVPVTGTPAAPRLGGDGPVLEWAVKMRAFPADATLDREGDIGAGSIDAIADRLAAFHGGLPAVPAGSGHGSLEAIMAPLQANFTVLGNLAAGQGPEWAALPGLEAWCQAEGRRLAPHFAARAAGGFVRECHGDLHLGNIAWVDGAPLIFDAIEFNAGLRCIDVINELAFLTMDLAHRGRPDLAWRCLNRYLEGTGDYRGLTALPFYQVYRALVRAKVAAIRAEQAGLPPAECLGYLALARSLATPRPPGLILMHGVSGSGKTWQSQALLEGLGAVRLRSDVERKRLFGLAALAGSNAIPGGIYGEEASRHTRQRLLVLARGLLTAGFRVIVDATFIRRDWRADFIALARETGVPWCIAACVAPEAVLRQRLAQRRQRGDDASEADESVLASQLAALEPFTPAEQARAVTLDDAPVAAIQRMLATP
ncbi:MAG: AAA family ATPase [Pseudomonadota bacterium]